MKCETVNATFNIQQIKEAKALKDIKQALNDGKQVLWYDNNDAKGKVIQGVNGIFIVGCCSVQGTITMPLLWSDGRTFTRPLDEFKITASTY